MCMVGWCGGGRGFVSEKRETKRKREKETKRKREIGRAHV